MTDPPPAGSRLFEGAALAGIFLAFAGPAFLLLSGSSALSAATLGYAGIAIFTGGIAARYGFIQRASPLWQLALNTIIAAAIAGCFYLVFLVLL